MLPQPASARTTISQHRFKQGVVRVARVERKYVMPDGMVKDENDISPVEKKAIAQRIMDELIAPLAHELVIQDLQRERETTN